MLTTIKELEKEIDQFHKNIKDSNELMRVLLSLSAIIKEQTESFEMNTEKIQNEYNEQLEKDRNLTAETFKKIQEKYENKLAEENGKYINQLQLISDNIDSLPNQLKKDSLQQYEHFLKELGNMIDARLTQLADTEKNVMALSKQLEDKYDSFVTKLESTNMDQLYNYCQDMNKSISTKLFISVGCVIVVIIISIIGLLI